MPYPDGFPTNGLISMSTIAGGFNSIAPHSLGDYYGADLEGWTDPDYVPPPATITNFEVASIPAGWVQNSTSAPSSGFSTTYGAFIDNLVSWMREYEVTQPWEDWRYNWY